MCVCVCTISHHKWLKRELGRVRLYRNIMKLKIWIRAVASEAGLRYKRKPHFPRHIDASQTS